MIELNESERSRRIKKDRLRSKRVEYWNRCAQVQTPRLGPTATLAGGLTRVETGSRSRE